MEEKGQVSAKPTGEQAQEVRTAPDGEKKERVLKVANPEKPHYRAFTVWAVMLLVLGLAAAVTWGTIMTFKANQTAECPECKETECPDIVPVEDNLAQQEADAKKAAAAIKKAVSDYLRVDNKYETGVAYKHGLVYFDVYDSWAPAYNPENSNVLVSLNRSYGFYADDSGYYATAQTTDALKALMTGAGFTAMLDRTFAENGFSKYDIGQALPGPDSYINKTTGILCTGIDSSLPMHFGCGHISWYNREEAELLNTLAKAYIKGENLDNDELVYLSMRNGGVQNSTYAPYQTVSAGGANAASFFYRVSPESEWRYFTSTQSPLACSRYDTDDLRKAFAGTVCYNGANESVVNP